MKLKFCGLTRPADIDAANQAHKVSTSILRPPSRGVQPSCCESSGDPVQNDRADFESHLQKFQLALGWCGGDSFELPSEISSSLLVRVSTSV